MSNVTDVHIRHCPGTAPSRLPGMLARGILRATGEMCRARAQPLAAVLVLVFLLSR